MKQLRDEGGDALNFSESKIYEVRISNRNLKASEQVDGGIRLVTHIMVEASLNMYKN